MLHCDCPAGDIRGLISLLLCRNLRARIMHLLCRNLPVSAHIALAWRYHAPISTSPAWDLLGLGSLLPSLPTAARFRGTP